jgi:hypothetical protein
MFSAFRTLFHHVLEKPRIELLLLTAVKHLLIAETIRPPAAPQDVPGEDYGANGSVLWPVRRRFLQELVQYDAKLGTIAMVEE